MTVNKRNCSYPEWAVAVATRSMPLFGSRHRIHDTHSVPRPLCMTSCQERPAHCAWRRARNAPPTVHDVVPGTPRPLCMTCQGRPAHCAWRPGNAPPTVHDVPGTPRPLCMTSRERPAHCAWRRARDAPPTVHDVPGTPRPLCMTCQGRPAHCAWRRARDAPPTVHDVPGTPRPLCMTCQGRPAHSSMNGIARKRKVATGTSPPLWHCIFLLECAEFTWR